MLLWQSSGGYQRASLQTFGKLLLSNKIVYILGFQVFLFVFGLQDARLIPFSPVCRDQR